jgi:hypothetical protein
MALENGEIKGDSEREQKKMEEQVKAKHSFGVLFSFSSCFIFILSTLFSS